MPALIRRSMNDTNLSIHLIGRNRIIGNLEMRRKELVPPIGPQRHASTSFVQAFRALPFACRLDYNQANGVLRAAHKSILRHITRDDRRLA